VVVLFFGKHWHKEGDVKPVSVKMLLVWAVSSESIEIKFARFSDTWAIPGMCF